MKHLIGAACVISAMSGACIAQEKCTTVSDCAQKAMEAAYQAKLALQIATPKGAVVAFNLDKCPDGWTAFNPVAGRMVLGAGASEGLKARKVGERGGEEEHRLTVDEMPSHTHNYGYSSGHNSPGHPDYTPEEFGLKDAQAATSAAGGDKPHNNMSPFYVLTYCEKQ